MLVTINTDASYKNEYNVGAYAFWITCNRGRIKKGGMLRKKCKNSDDAEAKAILNAITTLLGSNIKPTRVIVNTDSLNAIAILKNDYVHKKNI